MEKIDYLSASNPEKYQGKSFCYTLQGPDNAYAKIINYGAVIAELWVPDKNGVLGDVMLGLKGLDEYMANGANHGAVVGRSANRIAGASYVINGVKYEAPMNDGPNNLHGGPGCLQDVLWDAEAISKEEAEALIKASAIEGVPEVYGESLLLSTVSPDGCCGFPGNVDTKVLYAWLTDCTLIMLYIAKTDKDTIFAPTNHAYFNIAGHDAGRIDEQILYVNSDKITTKDPYNTPNGEYINVEGTCFDFRTPAPVKKCMVADHPQNNTSKGLDQNFCLNIKDGNTFNNVAYVCDEKTGRKMEVFTDLPGMQIYCGNNLGGTNDQKGDIPYEAYYAICLETQLYPNAINIPEFDSPILKVGETKYHITGYRFSK
ncbi:MAG: galactose mutarotase [Clostridia bacterium]|nr:galactose mutarotase [Clostridia bacterium]